MATVWVCRLPNRSRNGDSCRNYIFFYECGNGFRRLAACGNLRGDHADILDSPGQLRTSGHPSVRAQHAMRSLDPKETLSTGSLLEGRFDNVTVFEKMNLRGSAYQLDADRPRYLCRAGWEFPFLACAWT
jgi:hypothetical protein